jgi:hypothetical protein
MDDRTAPAAAAAEPDPIRAVRMIPAEIDQMPDPRTVPGVRKRRNRIPPVRVPKLILILIPTAIAIAAILAGVFLHLRHTPHANTLRAASTSAGGSASPTPTPTPTPTTSPTAATTGLPPVSRAPDVVQAIDTPSGVLPPGYLIQRVNVSPAGKTSGYSIDTPPGWQAYVMGQQTYQYTPNGGVTYVEIDLTRHVKSSMVAEAQYLSGQDRAEFPHYQPIHSPTGQPRKKYIQPENIRQTAGALWQFDWVNKRVKMRVDVLLFNLGQQSYTITMTAPAGTDDGNWNNRVLPIVAIMLHTFRPVA